MYNVCLSRKNKDITSTAQVVVLGKNPKAAIINLNKNTHMHELAHICMSGRQYSTINQGNETYCNLHVLPIPQ